jgi:hypothetical protein
MKKFLSIIIVLAVALFASAAICPAYDLIEKPAFQNLEGKWEGTFNTEGKKKNNSGSIGAIFTLAQNDRMSLSLELSGRSRAFGNVTIKGEKIIAENRVRKIVFTLYKKSDGKMHLSGYYYTKPDSLANSSAPLNSGTYELEYKGK